MQRFQATQCMSRTSFSTKSCPALQPHCRIPPRIHGGTSRRPPQAFVFLQDVTKPVLVAIGKPKTLVRVGGEPAKDEFSWAVDPGPDFVAEGSADDDDELVWRHEKTGAQLHVIIDQALSTAERGNVTGALVAAKASKPKARLSMPASRCEGTPDAIADAIRLYDRCLVLDPGFAPAYVAKAEAEVQLLELQKQTGSSNTQLADDALRDARTAAVKMPQLSRSHRTLARAYNAVGEYQQAKTSAERAIRISPNDFSALIAFAALSAKARSLVFRIPNGLSGCNRGLHLSSPICQK